MASSERQSSSRNSRINAMKNKKAAVDGGHSAILFGTDTDGIKRAFPLRIDAKAFNCFPGDLVSAGQLQPYNERAEWKTSDKVNYYDGMRVCEAVFFRHCFTKDELQSAWSECSAFLGEEERENGDIENGPGGENVHDDDDLDIPQSDSIIADVGGFPDSGSPAGRKRGQLPRTLPLSPSKTLNSSLLDPDYTPTKKRKTALKEKHVATSLASILPASEMVSPDLSIIINLLKDMNETMQTGFDAFSKKFDVLLKRVSNLESVVTDTNGISQQPTSSATVAHFFGSEFLKEDDGPFLWMGRDLRNDFNIYISSIDGKYVKATLIIRRLAERFMGARNLCYYRLTISEYGRDDARPDYSTKDPEGDKIIKSVINKLAISMRVNIRRMELGNDADIETKCDNYRAVLIENQACLKWAIDQANSAATDLRKTPENKHVIEKPSFYWTLLAQETERPNLEWTLFDECNDGSLKKINFKAGAQVPSIFSRMLELEKAVIAAKQEGTTADLKQKYDNFGKLLDQQ